MRRRIRADSFAGSRRSHLLTTHKWAVVSPSGPCALRGGCGSCGSLMDNAASHHCPRSRLNVLLYQHNKGMAIRHPLSRLPAETCHRQLFRRDRCCIAIPHLFSFSQKETKTCCGTGRRSKRWITFIWKQRL